MLIYLITYRKSNGELFQRLITTLIYEIGDYTSSGWYVLDIQVFSNGRFITLNEFEKQFNKEMEKEKKNNIKVYNKHQKKKNIILNIEKKINKFFKL